MSFGNSKIISYSYYYNPIWDTSFASTNNLINSPYAVNSISVRTNYDDYIDFYIEQVSSKGKSSLSAEGISSHYTGSNTVYNPFTISTPDYNSIFNDITPFIDQDGGFKVYFASDRYGKGNFDLYRYNTYTFNKLPEVKQLFSWDTTPPKIDFYYPANGQTITNSFLTIYVANSNTSGVEMFYSAKVYCSLDDAPFVLMGEDGDWSHSYPSILPGLHRIRVYGMDAFGNYTETNSASFTIVWPS